MLRKGMNMKSFKKMLESKRMFQICLFEEKKYFWPVIVGWTQHLCDHYTNEQTNIDHYHIEYFNDEKNFYVGFSIEKNGYLPNDFVGKWNLNVWGQEENGVLKSEKSIKSILGKCETKHDEFKVEGLKKIPSVPDWKKIVNDYEIAYSRKQNLRTVIVKISNLGAFIRNTWCGCRVCVYNDADVRYTESEFYEESRRSDFMKLMSNLDDKFFKK